MTKERRNQAIQKKNETKAIEERRKQKRGEILEKMEAWIHFWPVKSLRRKDIGHMEFNFTSCQGSRNLLGRRWCRLMVN